MFAAAFIGLTIVSFTILAMLGAPIPEPALVFGWRLFGVSLLSMASLTLPSCSCDATSTLLGAMGMFTAGLKLISVG